jgi:hypothetical protein
MTLSKACFFPLILVFAFSTFPAGSADAALNLVFTDPLISADLAQGQTQKTNKGGTFVSQGWKASASSSQLFIVLEKAIGPTEVGALEVQLTNFNPIQQYRSEKHQFISLYSRPDGSKLNWDDNKKCWWNIRGGTGYMTSGGAGFKFLHHRAGRATRVEVRLIQSKKDWDLTKTYTFRVEWTASGITFSLDGTRLHSGNFGGRIEALKYIFLGKDNVYTGFTGPVYKNLKIYSESGAATGITKAVYGDNGNLRLQVFPNPFSTSTKIQVLVRNDECGMMNVNCGIFNINGRQIDRFDQFRIHHSALGNSYVWSALNYPTGTYIIQAKMADKVISKSVQLAR